VTVEHDENQQRFIIRIGDEEAELAYSRRDSGVIDIQHTYVPETARGQGIAERLAQAAFQYVREQGARVIPTCPFIREWLTSHPDEAALVDRRYARVFDQKG
jgi:hypothetical protein